MKAIVVHPDRTMRWTEVPNPVPGQGELIVRVVATAVNRADLLQRDGKYPPPPGAPEWMGLEASGFIEELGEGASPTDWHVGDPVCCLLAGGGYAERVAVPAVQVAPVPEGIDVITAAGLPEVFATAYSNLYLEAGLRAGETVLIHAAASGVGTAAMQLARSFGSRVIATVGSPNKERFVRSLGAADVIDRSANYAASRLEELAKAPPGIDVVLDCLGGDGLARLFPLLNVGGRWVIISLLQGGLIDFDLRPVLSRRLRLIGSTLRSRPVDQKAEIVSRLRSQVWPLLERGEVKPIVHAIFPIEEAAAAHAVLERRENIGKVLLQVDPAYTGVSRSSRSGEAGFEPARGER